ncbi:MFS general substrate transporter [Suillus clintonianus]|uniref:MFS general substrate transporter n=1 Tax=Suillus clintonianus TaxID=1904413 RepID=UPI001B86E52F|nr:MFS general substrate transporter [Suillus clintonianus]KAG2145806.1 MFS general substrate transporter [Suillus clintonianus]
MSTGEEEKANKSTSSVEQAEIFERPKGWRGIYHHPVTQVCLVGLVCFMCPGIFNSLSGLGAGGQVDATTSANATATHYATLAFFAFFSGSVHNVLGSRLCLFLGTCGYPLYIASYIATNIHPGAGDFVVVTGAISGICAALIWTAQGSLIMAYPTEAQKGTFIGYFWAIFNLGSVVGSSVAFGLNFNSTANKVGNGTYIGLLILTLIGVVLPTFLVDPYKMIRTDGTKVTPIRHPSWKTEFLSLFVALKTDPWIVLLFPMFFASNYFYAWLFNDYNGALFNIRTRSLNNFVYWTSQIFGSFLIGHFVLDLKRFRRRFRAFLCWSIVVVFVFAIYTWAYFYQKTYTRASESPTAVKMDMNDPDYSAHVWLMILFGLLDSMWQTTAYWLMGAMSNDPAKLAVFAGFYKCFQSSGSAIAWRLDALRRPYMNIFVSTWVLVAAGMMCAFPLVYVRVKDHTEIDDEAL